MLIIALPANAARIKKHFLKLTLRKLALHLLVFEEEVGRNDIKKKAFQLRDVPPAVLEFEKETAKFLRCDYFEGSLKRIAGSNHAQAHARMEC